MEKFTKSLTKIGIKAIIVVGLYLWLSNVYRKYELFIMIGAALIILKLVLDIYSAFSDMQMEKKAAAERKLRKAGQVIGKKHAAPKKVEVPAPAPAPVVTDAEGKEKKIGRWLSLNDGRKLYD